MNIHFLWLLASPSHGVGLAVGLEYNWGRDMSWRLIYKSVHLDICWGLMIFESSARHSGFEEKSGRKCLSSEDRRKRGQPCPWTGEKGTPCRNHPPWKHHSAKVIKGRGSVPFLPNQERCPYWVCFDHSSGSQKKFPKGQPFPAGENMDPLVGPGGVTHKSKVLSPNKPSFSPCSGQNRVNKSLIPAGAPRTHVLLHLLPCAWLALACLAFSVPVCGRGPLAAPSGHTMCRQRPL